MDTSVEVAVQAKSDFEKRHRRDPQRADAAWKTLVRARPSLEKDPFFGTQIPKDRFPKPFSHEANLWKLDLPHAFRALYTIMGRPGRPIRVIIVWIGDHKEYDRLFGYA